MGPSVKAGWSVAEELTPGVEVKLQIETEGMEDGTLVLFEIWEREPDPQKEDKLVRRIDTATISGNKAEVSWIYELSCHVGNAVPGDGYSKPDYYYTAWIGDKKVRSNILACTAELMIEVVDENGEFVKGEPFMLSLSTGEVLSGDSGSGKINRPNVPPRQAYLWFPKLQHQITGRQELVKDPKTGEWVPYTPTPEVDHLQWAAKTAKPGETVNLTAYISNFDEPELTFDEEEKYTLAVYEYTKSGVHKKVSLIENAIDGDRMSGSFTYPEIIRAAGDAGGTEAYPQYFFTTTIRGIEVGLNQISDFLRHYLDTSDPVSPVGPDPTGPPTPAEPGCRPGYIGKEDPASAPDVLDFVKTDIVMKNLDEAAFRQTIVDTITCMDDLGLNRNKGAGRADAYLDMVTWDDGYRASWTNDNTENSSSCGMFVRNTWWLCGARGCELLDEEYQGGVLDKLLAFDTDAAKQWGSEFNAKTFYPKVGDVLYLFISGKNPHIFTISGIDKKIVEEDGQATVYNADGTRASQITFTSVDGGQEDGYGPDGKGKNKTWGCQAIKKLERPMKLNDGHFMNIGNSWPFPDGRFGRPVNTWINLWQMKDHFAEKYIRPVRGGTGTTIAASPLVSRGESAPSSGVDFYTWPTLSNPLPADIVRQVKKNRDALTTDSELYAKPAKNPTGYAYNGKGFTTEKCSAEEAADPKLKPIIERLFVEMSGEGGHSAVMTGDGAKFTWGRGLAHKGALENCMKYFIEHCAPARTEFLEYGAILDGDTWKIVDTDAGTVISGEAAIDYLNGTAPAALKKKLLTIFIKVTEDHGDEAATAQWVPFKKQFYYSPRPPAEVEQSWTPEAICYVVHCKAWGKFAGWDKFKTTGGDLKKILRMEVEHTGYFDAMGSAKIVRPSARTSSGNEIFPSVTILSNMGHGIMKASSVLGTVTTPYYAQSNDIVFEMNASSPVDFYILRDTSRVYNRHDEINAFVANTQNFEMSHLLNVLSSIRGNTHNQYLELKEIRDWYASRDNPLKEKYGLRPRVAMDAVLHRGEGESSRWILSDCARANISQDSHSDQYNLIKSTIGIP